MASARSIARLHTLADQPHALQRYAQNGSYAPQYTGYGGGAPYEATQSGRRLGNWNPSRLGPTGSFYSTRDVMLARCHDEIRNNPLAASAIDNFESQIVGNGIKPKWQLKNEVLKTRIETEFKISAMSKSIDYHGLCDFYGLQALAAREIFESGEVFVRRFVRPANWSANPNLKQPMRIPIQFQLIEAEQCPVWLNMLTTSTPTGSRVRTGKEYDTQGRLVAFHMYQEHPGETMFFNMNAMQFMRVLSSEMIHIYKPLRAGLLRGIPFLASVLVLLHELGKYSDATVVAKQVQAMFAAFITKVVPDVDPVPTDLAGMPGSPGVYEPPGVRLGELEPGSLNELFPGEDIKFPILPQNNDLQTFMSIMLHQFAAAIGATYEQVTGDLRGVNLSSIRSGMQEVRRKSEQFIYNVLITQFCQPLLRWWMDEAVLTGRLDLPGYAQEPEQYLDVAWMPSGWTWIDPQKDVEAKMTAVRCGFTSREAVCAETGEDASAIDMAQQRDNQRTDAMDLVYDIDPRKILVGKEASPQAEEEGAPEAQDAGGEPGQPGEEPQPPKPAVN